MRRPTCPEPPLPSPDLRDQLQATLSGSYTLERELGGGGMSRVFVATEAALGREIVIKVLPAETGNTVSVERFKREIAVVAKLQHPHIVPILTAGESQGLPYYTMPFVKGDSLRSRLAKSGELSVNETLHILRDIASALAYAHGEGVVHRDIKPENVMISGGVAVVTDFGVAKAMDLAITGGGHHQTGLTSLGIALGTPAYMAPEQATADPHVDHRADVYSFGCVAYEMLAGSSPFAGRPMQQLLAAHVTEQPEPLTRRRPNVPPALSDLVMKCLEKRAGDRPQSADELITLLDAIATPSGGTAPTAARLAAYAPPNRTAWAVTAGVVAVAAIAAAWWFARPAVPAIVLGKQEQLAPEPGLQIQPDISPDGKLVAYASGNFKKMRILIRPVGGGRTIPVSDDSSTLEHSPKWSPDGAQLLYLVRGGVSVAPALGGSSRAVVPPSPTSEVTSAAWSRDGAQLVFVRGDSLLTAAIDGGSSRLLVRIDGLHSCAWSPDGRWIACVSGNRNFIQPGNTFGNVAPSAIVVVPAGGGSPATVAEPTSANLSPVWAPDGGQLYYISDRDGTRDIYAVGVASGRARGAPTRLTTGLGAISLSLSRDGRRLAYSVYAARANLWSLPVPKGAAISAEGATALTSGSQVIEWMSISPDGQSIVYDSNLRGKSHIFRMPINGGPPEQLTNGPADEFAPAISPDGRAVAYHSWRTGTRDIEVKPLDGGEVERVTATTAQESYPNWSPDGRSLAFIDQVPPSVSSVTTRESPGRWSAPRPVATSSSFPQWSPDGLSVAFVRAGRTGTFGGQIFIVPAGGGSERRVSAATASEAQPALVRWDRDGKTLFYKSHDASGRASFWSIGVTGGRPRLLVHFDDLTRPSSRSDFATDGKRFYFAIEDRQSNVFVAEVGRK